MVLVAPNAKMDRHRVIEVLEASGPIDFDAKLEEWRQSGYDYSGAPRATEPARAEPTAASGGSGTGYKSGGTTAARPGLAGVSATSAGTTTQPMTGNQDTVKVVEERLRIGKREVAQGAVRVRSYVVERPVEEQVRLHEERVQIERRPVDRPVTPGDANLFQERTIEARATAEEAVVQKEARVVEEIGIKKGIAGPDRDGAGHGARDQGRGRRSDQARRDHGPDGHGHRRDDDERHAGRDQQRYQLTPQVGEARCTRLGEAAASPFFACSPAWRRRAVRRHCLSARSRAAGLRSRRGGRGRRHGGPGEPSAGSEERDDGPVVVSAGRWLHAEPDHRAQAGRDRRRGERAFRQRQLNRTGRCWT